MTAPTPSKPLAQLIAEMRDAASKATPGPWQVRRKPFTVDLPNGGTRDALEIITTWVHPQLKDCEPVIGVCIRRAVEDWAKHGLWLSEEDAAYIVLCVNNSDALPAALETAERLAEDRGDALDAMTHLSASRKDRMEALTTDRDALQSRVNQLIVELDEAAEKSARLRTLVDWNAVGGVSALTAELNKAKADVIEARETADTWLKNCKTAEAALDEAMAQRDTENNRRVLAEEDIEAQHLCLDEMGAPRKDENGVFSLHGRTCAIVEPLTAELAKLKSAQDKLIAALGDADGELAVLEGIRKPQEDQWRMQVRRARAAIAEVRG